MHLSKYYSPVVVFSVVVIAALIIGLFGSTPSAVYAQDGTPPPELGAEIIGGTEVVPGSRPWQVFLYIEKNGATYMCGGTLIGGSPTATYTQWVLTAAHCVTGATASSVLVVAGIHRLSDTNQSNYQVALVSNIIKHPSYNPTTFNNDVALLKLSNSGVSLNDTGTFGGTKIIPLTPSYLGGLAGNATASVSGWGRTEGGTTSDVLMSVNVPIVTNTLCNKSTHWNGRVTANMLCASQTGQSTCMGDSGGPLVVTNPKTGEVNLAGIVSWGPSTCGVANKESVYARASKFTKWVNTQMGVPYAVSIIRAKPTPSNLAEIPFTVTFSEAVYGVDVTDFSVASTGSISGASVSGISGSGTTYTVWVNTGSGDGTLGLNLKDDNSIYDLDPNLNNLGGSGADDGNFTGQVYTIKKSALYKSAGMYDGYITESGVDTNTGGAINSSAAVFNLGDNTANQEYRAILHFNTAGLPDNAIVTSAQLKIRKQKLTGANPFAAHGSLSADVMGEGYAYYGLSYNLEGGDYSAWAPTTILPSITIVNGWHVLDLSADILPFDINRKGFTQFRLRFDGSNNDSIADVMSFYSGNASTAAYRPQLFLKYYVP